MIEICPLCTPVVVSSGQSDRLLDSSEQSVSVERAKQILQLHDRYRKKKSQRLHSQHKLNTLVVYYLIIRIS